MRTYLFSLLVITFCLSGSVSAQKKNTTSDQIPILGWIGVPGHESTPTRYEEMRAAGFTHNYSSYANVSAAKVALDIAQEVGLKLIIQCPELKTNPGNAVPQLMNHPALAGYYLKDEPSRADFPELGAWAKRIRAVDDNHFCYLNLFPNYASSTQLGTETYKEYVNTFINEVLLKLLSFDHYPIMIDSDQKRSVRPKWYKNLEIIAHEAKKAGKPFWAFALATSCYSYPVPTITDLRLQVYSNLAYGAQGIQYFTYWTPNISDFHDGPIYEGEKTVVYGRVKAVNEEIKNLSDIFLGSTVISVFHTGTNIPSGTTQLKKLPKPITTLETEGEGAVVSFLEKDKSAYMVLVNRDLLKPMKLIVKGKKVKRILKDGTMAKGNLSELKSFEVEPGDVAIFRWKKKEQWDF